jgi:predicted GIY-YIG superfamily endonuclease
MARAEERLAAIADLIHECPPPAALAGYDQCAHGTWPCATTEAAWLAQGRKRDQELAKVREAVQREALIQDAEWETQQELLAAEQEGRRPYWEEEAVAEPEAGGAMDRGPGTVYLLHLDRPYQHARHYTGWAASSRSLKTRLAEHEAGCGARLLQVAKATGISWTLARTWPGGRKRERQLKTQSGASRCCPECGIQPRTTPAQQEEKTVMTKPPDKSAIDASRRRPDYVIELAVNPDLRDRARHSVVGPAQTLRGKRTKAAEPDPDPRLADREAEP